MPSRQEPSTLTPASRTTSKTDLSGRHLRGLARRRRTSSKELSSAGASVALRREPLEVQGSAGQDAMQTILDRGEQRLGAAAVDERVRSRGSPRIASRSSRPMLVVGHQVSPGRRTRASSLEERHRRAGAAAVAEVPVGAGGSTS